MAKVTSRNTRPIPTRALGRVNPVSFLKESFEELRKAVWPSSEETARLTMIVIALAIAAGFFLGGLDRVFAETFGRFVL